MFKLRVGIAALALVSCAGVAMAQTTTTPPATTTTPPATTTTPPADSGQAAPMTSGDAATTNEKPPLAGANSFTEGQARERIVEAGFQDVTGLKQDDQGIWRGQATKSGAQVGVALDYRGNVVQQ